MLTFETFENRYVFECTLKSEAFLHIGSGQEGPTTDAAVVKRRRNGAADPQPVAFIPGSSLRGVLRSTVERLLNAMAPGTACILYGPAAPMCPAGNKEFRERIEQGKEKQWMKSAEWKLCPVHRLFGSTIMASRLKIGDAEQKGADAGTEVRDGVGIDRDTGSAKEDIKYDFEVVNPQAEFRFHMELENAEREELALLYVLIRELERGVEVGGKKSRGLGRIQLSHYDVSYVDRGTLAEFLRSGKLRASESFKAEMEAAFSGYLGTLRQ
jgi:CRISPR-associated RAMP protein (TIGR02581 family)